MKILLWQARVPAPQVTFIAAFFLLGAMSPAPAQPRQIQVGQPVPPPPQQTPAPAVKTPAPAPQPVTTKPQAAPVAPPPTPQAMPATATAPGGLNLTNASLLEVIDLLARDLKINYILDPRVKGSVTINTYGDVKPVDLKPLLETILRMNGFAMVQVGNMYRIVPVGDVSHLPVPPQVNGKDLPDDERMILDLVFLKYMTSAEMFKLLEPFLGESSKMVAYDPANLLIIQDNSRNMRRSLELISIFDSDAFAGQRVRLFDVTNGRPTDLVKELDTVFKAYALSEKNSAVHFLPVDRINTIIAVAPNPGAFAEVEKWLKKLDIPIKATAGS
ncbi:MAG: hypothetical protein M3Z85_18905, partial [Acidobacteriota bacterium]|nr:hypothetical protein [Acidobacteriota bacterium]